MFGLDLDAWITILTIVTLMAAFLLTRLRSDVGVMFVIATGLSRTWT